MNNRFGHGGHFYYRYLRMPQLIEFQFADLDILTNEEYDFLGYIIYEAETIPAVSEKSLSTTNRRRI